MPDLYCNDCFSISPMPECQVCKLCKCQYCCAEAQWLIWGSYRMSIIHLENICEEIHDYKKTNEETFFLCNNKCLDILIMSFYDKCE